MIALSRGTPADSRTSHLPCDTENIYIYTILFIYLYIFLIIYIYHVSSHKPSPLVTAEEKNTNKTVRLSADIKIFVVLGKFEDDFHPFHLI